MGVYSYGRGAAAFCCFGCVDCMPYSSTYLRWPRARIIFGINCGYTLPVLVITVKFLKYNVRYLVLV